MFIFNIFGVASCNLRSPKLHYILVGTEEGNIHIVTTHFSSKALLSFPAHSTPVRCLTWNHFITDIFLSCGTEMTIKIWRKDVTTPLFIFELQNQVTDVCWSADSSTVFGASTVDGRVHVFDLSINKYSPVCSQPIVPR